MKKTPCPASDSHKRGFTLAETLVVIAIVSVVGLALSTMITYFYKSNAFLLEQTAANDSAQRGLTRAFESLREASYGEDGSYPILQAATSSITFYSDIDTDTPVEKVRLYLSNGTFYRGVTNAAGNPPTYTGQAETVSTIATNVKNAPATPLFRYIDSAGTELSGVVNLSDIAAVRIHLEVDLNPARAPNILILEQTATIRNLR